MKRWYVVQVYAGYEEAVKADIERRIKERALEERFGEILIPAAKLRQFFEVADTQDQQLFPGYLLIEMEMMPETMRAVTLSPRVLRFLGGMEPAPLSQKEIDRILSQIKGEITVGKKDEAFVATGSEIEIKEGPFAGFVGVVEKVDHENEKLTVMVSIFGRMTPVELGFHQIKQ
jgi:transcriptional antiterminator NusG